MTQISNSISCCTIINFELIRRTFVFLHETVCHLQGDKIQPIADTSAYLSLAQLFGQYALQELIDGLREMVMWGKKIQRVSSSRQTSKPSATSAA